MKFIIVLIAVSAGASSTCAQINPFSNNVGGYTYDGNYKNLAAACTAAGNGTLAVTRAWKGLPGATFDCNIWFMPNGGSIQPAILNTISLTGNIQAAQGQQIFDLSVGGKVTLSGKVNPVYPQWWGAKFDNETDDTRAWQYAINERNADGGGQIACQGGVSLIAGQLSYNFGAYPAAQSPIGISGSGATNGGFFSATAPSGGCWMNMTYDAGPRSGKLLLLSVGSFRIWDVTVGDTSADCSPFIKVVNTNLQNHISFQGSASQIGPSACHTGIVYGGQTSPNGGGEDNWFAGYGSHASQDLFTNMSTGYLLQAAANNVVLDTPAFGYGDGGACAIKLDGTFLPGSPTNVHILSPIIEQTFYTNTICFNNSGGNVITAGSQDDAFASILLSGAKGLSNGNLALNFGGAENVTDSAGGNWLMNINGAGAITMLPSGSTTCQIQWENGTGPFIQFSYADNSARCPIAAGQITSNGSISARTFYTVGAAAGVTATAKAGSCVLTIVGGIITGVTGC